MMSEPDCATSCPIAYKVAMEMFDKCTSYMATSQPEACDAVSEGDIRKEKIFIVIPNYDLLYP